MANQVKQSNDFKDKSRPATITAVDPQNKKVSVKYTTQNGDVPSLDLAFQNVGATWGRLYCPQVGDRVYIDQTQGEVPVIVGMKPTNPEYLPYLDPGELAETNSDGSYIHLRNKRRRDMNTNALLPYDTQESSAHPKIETEPGGIVLGVRSKQNLQTKAPRWYEHSYLSMFDNGDIAIQSRYQSKEKGLLYFDGASGYSIWTSGDGRPQSYIEQDPVNQCMTYITDGEMHFHTQTNHKRTVYTNDIKLMGGGVQLDIGRNPTSSDPTSGIPPDFKKIVADSDLSAGDYHVRQVGKFLHIVGDRWEVQVGVNSFTATSLANQGDIYLDNTATSNGKLTVKIKGDADLTIGGNVNLTVSGNVTAQVTGNASLQSNGNVSVQASDNVTVTAQTVKIDGTIYLDKDGSTDPVVTQSNLNQAIQNHVHQNTKPGLPGEMSGMSLYTQAVNRSVYA